MSDQVSDQEWIDRVTRAADRGEPYWQVALAWEYYKGEILANDEAKAKQYLAMAEMKRPQYARFHMAKMDIISRTFRETAEFRADIESGYAPSQYLYSVALERNLTPARNGETPCFWLAEAERNGHVIAALYRWRNCSDGLLSAVREAPYALRMIIQLFRITLAAETKDDVRIMK